MDAAEILNLNSQHDFLGSVTKMLFLCKHLHLVEKNPTPNGFIVKMFEDQSIFHYFIFKSSSAFEILIKKSFFFFLRQRSTISFLRLFFFRWKTFWDLKKFNFCKVGITCKKFLLIFSKNIFLHLWISREIIFESIEKKIFLVKNRIPLRKNWTLTYRKSGLNRNIKTGN